MTPSARHGPAPSSLSTADHPRPARFEFTADDPDSVYRHVRRSAPGFHLHRIEHPGVATLSVDEIRDDTLLWVQEGEVRFGEQAETPTAAGGDVRLLTPGARPVSLRTVDARMTVVQLRTALPPPPSPPAWLLPLTETSADVVRRTVSYVSEMVDLEPPAGHPAEAEPLTDALTRLLRATALSGFPSATGDGYDRAGSFPKALQAALAYIDANRARRVTLSELAGAAFTTPRTVQHLFRRYLDVTPTAYVRQVRLAAARQELLTAHRSEATVTATAARWGFGHTGRFAVLYRQTYGESPHQTLGR